MGKKLAVAFGGLKTFAQCPHKYYRTKVTKDVKEDFSHPATVWGQEVHKALEDFLKGNAELPKRFASYYDYAYHLLLIPGDKYIELKIGMDEDSNPCDFFASNVAYRGVLDFLSIDDDTAYLIDHKTGKVRPTKQLHFNALLIFANFPEVEKVRSAFFWLPADSYTKYEFTRDDVESLWRTFEPYLVAMEEAKETDTWKKKPSGLCPWCPVKDCEHWGPK